MHPSLFYNIAPLLTPAQQIVPVDWPGILREPVVAGPQTKIKQTRMVQDSADVLMDGNFSLSHH